MPQSGFNLDSMWLQHGTNMAPIWWFCQAAAKFVIEQKMWLKKNWPCDPESNVELFDVASPWCLDT